MSPSEFELRDALHHGEGDADGVLDVSAIIARGDHVRRERRVRYLSTAAAAVVVAGVTTGIVLNTGSSNHNTPAAAQPNAQNDAGVGAGNANGGIFGAASPTPATVGASVQCAPQPPAIGVPTGSTRSESFFTEAVTSFDVCAYRTDGTSKAVLDDVGQQLSISLVNGDATQVARSLDDASTVQNIVPCPLQPGQIVLTLRPHYGDGSAGPLILAPVQAPCALPTTNGTAVRYAWVPPSALDAFLTKVRKQVLIAYVSQPTGNGYPSPTNT